MNEISRTTGRKYREKQAKLALALGAVDGGKATPHTRTLLNKYVNGDIAPSEMVAEVQKRYGQRA